MPREPQYFSHDFRRRLGAGEILLGSFIKTPTPHATEIFGLVGFDFVVIDQEHAPFDRPAIDTILLAARAKGIAGLVRVAEATPAQLLAALDDGAAGVLVPHVTNAHIAAEIAAACRYRGGTRGCSPSPRAGDYGGRGLWEHVDAQDAEITVIAMIEDAEALDHLDAIMAVRGIDAVFIGRGDLTVALGASDMDSKETMAAVEKISAAAIRAGKPILMVAGGRAEAERFRAFGASGFVVASDQGFIRHAAAKMVTDFRNLT